MARIRTIKPEFWTDETITECSLSARLLFIGIWNFADDNGNIERSSKQMKMKIFPADNIEVEPLVLELMSVGLLLEYENNGDKFLNIRGFVKHQVINRPSKTKQPKIDDSGSTPVPLTEYSRTEGKGREGKGEERINAVVVVNTTSGPATAAETIMANCFDFYRDRLQELYPHADYEVERETCIAHYRKGNPPLDPWPVILKWFNRVTKPTERGQPMTFAQMDRADAEEQMRTFVEGD